MPIPIAGGVLYFLRTAVWQPARMFLGNWINRSSLSWITSQGLKGVKAVWGWFTGSQVAQVSAGTWAISETLQDLVDNATENAKTINTIIAMVCILLLCIYLIPSLVRKYL